MKQMGVLLFFLVFSLSAHANIQDKAIYGEDNRLEVFQVADPLILEATKSVAAQIFNLNVEETEANKFLYSYIGYGEKYEAPGIVKLCAKEKFLNQPSGAACTGFLIAEDKLLTAGHCVAFDSDCEEFYWVFDLKYKDRNQLKKNEFKFSSDQLVRCTKVERRAYNGMEGMDYAVVTLDRKIKNRPILKLRETGKVTKADTFTVIGFPGGIPMKVSSEASFRKDIDADIFSIESDTFHGNSGSPVLNQKTGLVEGILVRGDVDYSYNKKEDCRNINKIKPGQGRGEDVVRILSIMKDK